MEAQGQFFEELKSQALVVELLKAMNPIVKVDKSKKVPVYTVRKIVDDTAIKSYERRFVEESDPFADEQWQISSYFRFH